MTAYEIPAVAKSPQAGKRAVALKALLAKAGMAEAPDMEVAICGTRKGGQSWD